MEDAGPKKLFKYHLDQNMRTEANRPLFFRRMNRWRNNSFEYAVPFAKKGVFRGYIKYGVFTYAAYHYTMQTLFAPAHHGHDDHGKGHH
mmetsp:Transcript_5283/g.6482  ORF Transcript_5283/g.6482 Transcript_5283/m.6482 type:complete len:89 (-) Transcript_5283:3995-4261(-)